jgi:hypothetical protein
MAAPVKADRDREDDADQAEDGARHGKTGVLDQRPRRQKADRHAVDRQHAHPHDPAAEGRIGDAQQQHRHGDHAEALDEARHEQDDLAQKRRRDPGEGEIEGEP